MENENLNEQQIQEPEQEPAAVMEEPVVEPVAEEPAEEVVESEEAEEVTEPEVTAEEPVIIPPAPVIKKGYTAKVVLITLLCVVLAAVLVVGVLAGTGVIFNDDGDVQETTENVEETTVNPNLKSYTVSDEEAIAAQNTVVATVGDLQLTNSALQVDYWTSVYEYYNSYGYYLYMMGVDFSQPLDTLVYDEETNTSWQEFLLEYSLSIWHQYAAIQHVAEDNNFVMTQEQLDYMEEMDSYMQQVATENGFATVEDLVKAQMGAGATVQGYQDFTNLAYKASCYVESYQASINPTDEELDAYFTENEAKYTEQQITKDSKLVDVRHILVKPEGGTTDENGNVTYSEEEWEACRQKAQDLYDQWLAGDATEDSFAALAGEKTEDPGSAETGGLYEGVKTGDMVPEFNDWIFDESRVQGDHGLVKTTYGYHIMFYVDAKPQWLSVAKADFISDKISEMVTAALEQYPLEVDYEAIALSAMTLG